MDRAIDGLHDELREYLEARNKALLHMDFAFVRKQLGEMSDEMCLLVLHKGRYDCTALPAAARHVSAAWLRENGYRDMNGEDILPEGELPE